MALEQKIDLTAPIAEEGTAPSQSDAPPPPSDHKDSSDLVTAGPLQGWEAPLSDPSISNIRMQEDSKGLMAVREVVDQAYLDKFRGYDVDIARGTAEPSSPRPVAKDHPPLKPPAPATLEPSLSNLPSPTKALPSPSKPNLSVKSRSMAMLVPRLPHVSTDDSVYYVVTGSVVLQLFHSPIGPHDNKSKDEAKEGANGSTVSKSLAILAPGESFSSSTMDLLSNSEELTRPVLPASKDKALWEHGAIQSFQATAAHGTSVTARTRRDTTSSSSAVKAEVLHIPRPTLEMINSSGKPLSVDEMVDKAIFSNTFWSSLVSGEGPRSEKMIMARRFARFLTKRKEKEALPRVHEYKQGTELLRRGEAAACAFVVVKGECVLRGNYVGLLEAHAGSAAHTTDLGVLHAGQSAGELSLLADRPLWYSLIVTSSTATVVSLDLATLKLFFKEDEGDATRLLSLTAEEDRKLYAFAVQKQSMLIQAGKLDLSLFNGAMKSLLNSLMAMGHLNVSDILMHFTSYVEADEGSVGSPKTLLHSYAPVVLDVSTTLIHDCCFPLQPHQSLSNLGLKDHARHHDHCRQCCPRRDIQQRDESRPQHPQADGRACGGPRRPHGRFVIRFDRGADGEPRGAEGCHAHPNSP
jgi:CRP-like cAMP-binding protein